MTKVLFSDKITEIFYDFDEYLKINYPKADQEFSLTNQPELSLSEMASIETVRPLDLYFDYL